MRKHIDRWSEAWVLRAASKAPGPWGWLIIVPLCIAGSWTAYASGSTLHIILATALWCLSLLDVERHIFSRIIERQQAEITALKWESTKYEIP